MQPTGFAFRWHGWAEYPRPLPQNLTAALLCPPSLLGKAGASEPSNPATEAAEGSPDTSLVLLAVREGFPPGKMLPLASPRFPVVGCSKAYHCRQPTPCHPSSFSSLLRKGDDGLGLWCLSIATRQGLEALVGLAAGTQVQRRQVCVAWSSFSHLTLHISFSRDFALLLC